MGNMIIEPIYTKHDSAGSQLSDTSILEMHPPLLSLFQLVFMLPRDDGDPKEITRKEGFVRVCPKTPKVPKTSVWSIS